MQLPQHWAQVSGFSPHLGASGGDLVVWGWSETSDVDAEGVARARLAEALDRIAVEGLQRDGHTYYPRMPLREPVLEEVLSAAGQRLGVVTRNRMGCEVLCTDVLFIADVDVPELADESSGSGGASLSMGVPDLGGLFGRLKRMVLGDPEPTVMSPAPADTVRAADLAPSGDESDVERRACEPVWAFAQRHPELGVRLYRTAAGLRVIVTGAQAPPMSDRARELLTELGSDPLYVELCATHDSYRARLTPKPFRVDFSAATWQWPFVDERTARGHEQWVSEYRERSDEHAVCRLVSASGAIPDVDEQRLVALHDARTLVGSGLPLA